jgi:hypothetical protein
MDVAKDLRARLADIVAAESMEDLVAGRPCELVIDGRKCYAVHLIENYRVILAPNHQRFRKLHPDALVERRQVTRVQILRIEKDHTSERANQILT